MPATPAPASQPYSAGNLLDRLTPRSTLEVHYRQLERRERVLLSERVDLRSGRVLSVGCGWHPGRHLFPAPDFRLVAVDADRECVESVTAQGSADEVLLGRAGQLGLPRESFDVVLYRLVLHHVAFQGPLDMCFREASELLRPGGVLIVIEPGLWHPVGLALALANRLGVARMIHGTRDDLPLSPRHLLGQAHRVGLEAELHAVTYTWRRLPPRAQARLQRFDVFGSDPRLAIFGHTLMLIAHKRSA